MPTLDLAPAGAFVDLTAVLAQVAAAAFDDFDASVAALRQASPDDPGPLLRVAAALVAGMHFGRADALLAALMEDFPGDERVTTDYAMVAHHRHDWPETCRRWRAAWDRFPHAARFAARLGATLQVCGLLDEADAVLSAAAERFPGDIEVASEYARLALRRGDGDAAATRWAHIRERFPDHSSGCVYGAEALRELGRYDEAEAVLDAGRDRFELDFQFMYQAAWNATRQGRWQVAFDRWAAIVARFPKIAAVDEAIGTSITLWRLAAADGDEQARSVTLPEAIASRAGMSDGGITPGAGATAALADRDLAMAFEGMGDRCEFGLVQRHFGAEPMDLLRWCVINPFQLVAALTSRFDGVGEPDTTTVSLIPGGREYFAGDSRYFFMHTFIKEGDATPEMLLPKMCQRMKYLKNKLLADLDEGQKIFVYKKHRVSPTPREANAIISAMAQHYPASVILLLHVADDQHPPGTAIRAADNAIFGYLSTFVDRVDSRFIRYDEWRGILLSALDVRAALPVPAVAAVA